MYWEIGQKFIEKKTRMVWELISYSDTKEICQLRHSRPTGSNEYYIHLNYNTQELASAIAFSLIVPLKK